MAMAMPEDDGDTADEEEVCVNCALYGWECDMSKPKRCASCKKLSYCSRICQLEHWNKVHRKHCKYLAGTKVKDKAGHETSFCPKCQIVQGVKKTKELKNPKSGIYPCLFNTKVMVLDFKSQRIDGVVFGEISGKFTCQVEHCFSIITHCCLKLAHTHTQAMEDIFYKLGPIRQLLSQAAISYPNDILEEKIIQNILSYINELFQKITELCEEHFSEEGDNPGVKWWRSLQVFQDILKTRRIWGSYMHPYKDDFRASIEPVLQAASLRMPPFAELLQAMVGGPEGTCRGCHRNVQVDGLEVNMDWPTAFGGERGWVFLSHRGFKTACNECLDELKNEDNAILYSALTDINTLSNHCHNCDMLCRGRPRCKDCKAKVYCSEECQATDLEVHQMFCKSIQEAMARGEMGRKVSKREMDKKTAENLMSTLSLIEKTKGLEC